MSETIQILHEYGFYHGDIYLADIFASGMFFHLSHVRAKNKLSEKPTGILTAEGS